VKLIKISAVVKLNLQLKKVNCAVVVVTLQLARAKTGCKKSFLKVVKNIFLQGLERLFVQRLKICLAIG